MRLTALAVAVTLGAVLLSSSADAQEGGITGEVPSEGIALIRWDGGPVENLIDEAGGLGCAVTATFTARGGILIGFLAGAPPFVNARWMAEIGEEIPPGTFLILLCTPAPPGVPLSFTIDWIDVGQGDATLITVDGERLLIDGGRSQARIEERLTALGIDHIDAILSTHPDADHIAGLIRVLQLYEVERVYLNGGTSTTQTWSNYIALVEASDAEVIVLRRGDAIPLGRLEIDVLHPGDLTGDLNRDSLVVLLSCGTVDVLLTGDATIASENEMIAGGVLGEVTVLKVGHHGSSTSTGQAFLDIVQPQYAVISAGMTSQFGHPHPEVVARLIGIGATLYHTDTTPADDTITMTSDCTTVEFGAEQWTP